MSSRTTRRRPTQSSPTRVRTVTPTSTRKSSSRRRTSSTTPVPLSSILRDLTSLGQAVASLRQEQGRLASETPTPVPSSSALPSPIKAAELSDGAIVGISVSSAVAFVLLCVLLGMCFLKRFKRSSNIREEVPNMMAPSVREDPFENRGSKVVLPSHKYSHGSTRYSISHARRRESKGTGTSGRTLDSENTVVDLLPEDLEPIRFGPIPKRRLS